MKVDEELYKTLRKPKDLVYRIKSNNAEIAQLKSLLFPGGIRYDQERVKSSPDDKMQKFFAEIDEKERENENMMSALFIAVRDVRELVDKLDDDKQKSVLLMRYNACLGYEEIAERLNYSLRHTLRIYKESIKELEETVKNEDSQKEAVHTD